MKEPLRILLLEDDPTDAELIQQLLVRNKMDCTFRHAMSKNEFLDMLDEFSPQVILSDNSMPQFNSAEALRLVRQRFSHIPFILVTGTVSEEFATTMIKDGADDYILKDRMARLPAAITAAISQRRALKEITDYKYALDQAAIVAISDENGEFIYANANFCKVSKYSLDDLVGENFRILNSGYHSPAYFQDMIETINSGNIWRGELRNKAKDSSTYWVDAIIVPFLNEAGKPYQFLSIHIDITQKKRLEAELFEQQRNEQLKITSTAIQAEEKTRTLLGRELHDNVNQLLVGTKLYLSMVSDDVEKNKIVITKAMNSLQSAIEENRKIAHNLVTPDFEEFDLVIQIKKLSGEMMAPLKIAVEVNSNNFDESVLKDAQKLAVYRIVQEQCTNIVKYAKASEVRIKLQTKAGSFLMTIADNGKGMKSDQQSEGIGLRNIKGRLSVFNGAYTVNTAPGEGFQLIVAFPI